MTRSHSKNQFNKENEPEQKYLIWVDIAATRNHRLLSENTSAGTG